ncbi:MAG TPA: M48 family metalloprotease [Vicinamibacterales bacterium]|nr:M48 family metalloprotease [Vicinamibacterales bacterium]
MRRRWIRTAPALALLAAIAACARNPVTGEREFSLMSESQEIALGKQYHEEVLQQMQPYEDPELQKYVQDIANRLAAASHRPQLPWNFTVVDVAAVNAFALPGGYIYMTRGIITYLNDEAELAGVLGHEIGHVTARHAARQYTRATGGQLGLIALGVFVPEARPFGQLAEAGLSLLFLKYGRDDELQSDRLGIEYLAKTGWDANAVPDFLTTLARLNEESDRAGVPNWLSTHPQPGDRVVEAREAIAKLGAGTGGRRNRDEYLRQVDGVIFGDNPEEGIVRDGEFVHPVLLFGVRFPADWPVNNSPAQVVSRDPKDNRLMLLQLEQAQGSNVEQVAVAMMQKRGLQLVEGRRGRVNGLEAFVGTYRGRMQDGGEVGVRGAHIVHGGRIFLLVGLTPANGYNASVETFDRVIGTFRPITRGEAADIKPNRVRLYTVRPGDTWQSIAQRNGGIVPASTLAIINDHAPGDPPRAGERIKIVVAG